MNIIFEAGPGRLRDFIESLGFLYNRDYRTSGEEFWLGIEKHVGESIPIINPYVEDALKELSVNIHLDRDNLEVFFHKDLFLIYAIIPSNDIWVLKDVAKLPVFLKSLSEDEVKRRVIRNLLDSIDNDDKKIKEILFNERKIIELIELQKCSADLKWNLLKFIQNVKFYMEVLISNLENSMKPFHDVTWENMEVIQAFNDDMENQIRLKGSDFLKEYIKEMVNYESCSDLCITTSFFNSYSLNGDFDKNKMFIYFGIDSLDILRQLRGEGDVDRYLNVFKNLSDNSRFQILRFLMNGALYGQEIADKVGISMATVSYHMNFLLATNLVKVEKQEGRRTYYTLNKHSIQNCIVFLKRTFKLNL